MIPNEAWHIVEHNWESTSIYGDDDWPICTLSIHPDVTEETQSQFEAKVAANAALISSAPALLKILELIMYEIENIGRVKFNTLITASNIIEYAKDKFNEKKIITQK